MIERITAGVARFQREMHGPNAEEFKQLVAGQKPLALFVTCSDSRVNPNLLTQTRPGELFIIRNAGNMIPPFPAAGGGEGGTIEFAMNGLRIPHIIVCGHSHCGAMKAALDPDSVVNMPSLKRWLEFASVATATTPDDGGDPEQRLMTVTQRNVLAQLDNLRTYPCVAAALAEKRLKLHAWVYRFEVGEVLAYSESQQRFVPLTADAPAEVQA